MARFNKSLIQLSCISLIFAAACSDDTSNADETNATESETGDGDGDGDGDPTGDGDGDGDGDGR